MTGIFSTPDVPQAAAAQATQPATQPADETQTTEAAKARRRRVIAARSGNTVLNTGSADDSGTVKRTVLGG